MSLLTLYRERLHCKEVEKEILEKKSKDSPRCSPILSAGILLYLTNNAEYQQAKHFLKTIKKEIPSVSILAYVHARMNQLEFDFDCFYKKDLDWLWRPDCEVVNQFVQQRFDILINLSDRKSIPLERVAVLANANYKIGVHSNRPNDYNLMLEAKDYENYLQQILYFLPKI